MFELDVEIPKYALKKLIIIQKAYLYIYSNVFYLIMLVYETKKGEFKKNAEKGKKYEMHIQQQVAKYSTGSVHPNVTIGNFCEFDLIVANYPILSFVEIKFYRANLKANRVRQDIRKFRNHCKRVTEEELDWKKKWIPYTPPRDSEIITKRDILLKKLSLFVLESWKYRMILIVPNKSINVVLDSLNEDKAPSSRKHMQNLRMVDDIPILVIPQKRIQDVFG